VPLLLLLAALAVLAAIAVVAAGAGGSMGTSTRDRSPRGEMPVDDVDRAAIEGLRFSLAFRGYRMDEVDEVLGRLTDELEIRDRRIAELEGEQPVRNDAAFGAEPAARREQPVRTDPVFGPEPAARGEQPHPPAVEGRPATDAPNEA
jgi:DivIVA domain-containing protein